MAVKKIEGEVLWLDAKVGALNDVDAKGSVHIIRAKPNDLMKIEKGNKVEIHFDGSWVRSIRKKLS